MYPDKNNKVLYFEYTIYRLSEWVKKNNPKCTHPEFIFSKLKALKLLFFVAAVGADANNNKLLYIFNKFYAMPYGPVESDIYNSILNHTTKVYDIFDRGTLKKNAVDEVAIFSTLDKEIKKEIDDNIMLLLKKNSNIINLPPYKLVDISHKWSVWIDAMSIADILGKKSEIMPICDIISSSKFYE